MDQYNTNEPPKKRGGVLKWVLIGCGGLAVIAIAVAVIIGGLIYKAAKGVSTDPVKVEAVAREILQFEKPSEYKGIFSMSILGVKSALFEEGENGGTIALMTIPSPKASRENIERQLTAAMEKGGRSQTAISEKRPNETFNVRGKDIEAEVGVIAGTNSTDTTVRYSLLLENSSGKLVMLMISGNVTIITHDWIQELLDSVR